MRRAGMLGCVAIAGLAALTGCATDMGRQLASNPKLREAAMGAIAANAGYAEQMAQRLVANDSLRARVIDTMLQDDRSAQYVLMRIGTNPQAVGYVLQAAAHDSAGRANLITLLKGFEGPARKPR